MDINVDLDSLLHSADRLSALAGDLMAAAHRLSGVVGAERRSRPGSLAQRCAGLGAGLRSDAAELLECTGLLRQDRAGLLAGEASALAAVADPDRLLGELPGWAQ
ncbi:MAG: hypothetical protein M3Z25_09185 [Actinomycetota bacterium]|nr:hypothetical protein [Actinomycetota bacterium]